jgi:HTH-type transcriptional regulator/antitoxin HigA
MTARIPAEVFPPAEYLQDELDTRGWNRATLARAMGQPVAVVNRIFDGASITAETDASLSRALGTNPGFWLRLQDAYSRSTQ